MNSEYLRTYPAVYAVCDTYHIMVPVKTKCTMWVRVGDEEYFDESNGILKSNVTLHKMVVPAEELNREKKYTICLRKMIDRKPYFSETGDVVEMSFDFKPVCSDEVRAYHISDAHTLVKMPVKAAKYFEEVRGKIDFLVLNGDVPDSSGKLEHFDNIYDIVSELTQGNIPVIFSRGNHDMRGVCAENIAEYTPCHNGNSFFSFRLGNIWGLVIDCGEDKPDDSNEYGNTICCHAFRKRETQYIKDVIANKEKEYGAEGVEHKIVIAHHPFTTKQKPPFDIEQELYKHWAELLKENVDPEVMICGHMHTLEVLYPGNEKDVLGQPCPIVIGAKLKVSANPEEDCYYAGAGYTFKKDCIEVVFTDSENKIIDEHIIDIK